MRRIFACVIFLCFSASTNGWGQERNYADPADVLDTGKSLTSFYKAFLAADAMDLLKTNNGDVTLYAPWNKAFDAMPPEIREKLFKPENKELLRTVLKHHIVPHATKLKALENETFTTLAGEKLTIRWEGNLKTYVGGARLLSAQDIVKKGTIIGIGEVLIPESVKKALGLPERTD
jgi:Secreted and surface protein containing fasciclin-like repeats